MSGTNNIISCPACNTSLTLRGKALTRALTCKNCGVYFRTGSWNKEQEKFQLPYTFEPVLPIGAKGEIGGFIYEVMGVVIKKERKYKYSWREYLIFNRHRGYAFLSEYDGHWNMVWPVDSDPRASLFPGGFYEDGQRFLLYQKYSADVAYARGEFFFDVVDMTASTRNEEYINPPHFFALESSDDSMLWCKGEYIQRNAIADIFSVPLEKLPRSVGLGYTQPASGSFSISSLVVSLIVLILATFVIQYIISARSADENIFHRDFTSADFKDQKFVATTPFHLNGGPQSIQINIHVPVDNDWFFSEFALVNETTGEEYNFTKEVEYYHGYDYEDGGSYWSEGGTTAEAYISRLPDGTYHVNIYPAFGTTVTGFDIAIWRDVPSRLNVLWTIIGLAIFPVIYIIWAKAREKGRWADSDYSPYE
jgi:hypothetical protein